MAKAVKSAVKVFVVTFAVVTGLAAIGVAFGVGTLTTFFGAKIVEIATLSAVGTLVGGLMSKGIKATAAENFGNKVATRTATAPRQIIYGKARVGGTITHIETSGTDNYKLSMIVVLAGHEVESLEDVLINDEVLVTVSSGGYQYATNSKFINADNENKFSVQSSLLRYVFVDGSQTTANSTIVNNTSLTSSDKFIGMSYVLIEMVVDSEAFGGGIPPMAFVVKGKKVYDPRTSSTAWSDNPALCVRDYITDTTYGLKATSSEVLDTTALGGFASAANTCDTGNTIGTVTVNGAISSSTFVTVDTSSTLTLIDVGQTVTGTGISGVVKVVRRRGLLITLSSAQTIADGVTLTFTEELYTANGITNMSASGGDVIEGLLSACAGKLSYIDGKFVMFAGASVSPDMTITDDNLLAPISIATKQSSGETFNTVKAVYVDANNNYVATDSPTETPINPDSSVTFLSEDTPTGESQPNYRKTLEIQLPFTDTTTMAQRLQRTALLHTRKEVSLSVLCNIAYMQLQPFDWVYLTNERLGYTNKTFEVLSTNLEVIESDDVPVLATRLALKEIDSSVYAFASSSYTSPIDEGTSVSTGSFSVTAPTGLSVSATLINTGYDLQVQWTNNPDDLIQGTEILYGTSSGTYIGSLIAGKGKTKEIIPNVKANSVYYIVARHFSANNVFSANTSEENINTNSDAGIVTPSAPTSLSATTGKPLSIGLSWSNPSSTDLRDIQIYRSTTAGFTPNDGTNLVRTIAGVPSVTQKVSFGVDDGLVESTNYYFKVKAVSFFDKVSSASGQAIGSFTKVEATDINLPDFSGYFHKEGNTTTALTSAQFNTEYGRTPLNDDILIMVNTSASPKVSKAYKWNGSSFVEITNFTTGDLVVDGTLGAAKIVTGSLSSESGVFGSISAGDIDTGTLNAANVTISGGDVTINNSGIAISGSSSSINLGSGAFIVTSGGGLTATNAIITGEVNATSGTFNGSIAIGSGNNIFKADTNGIYLGNTSYASALFKVSPAGVVQSDKRITSGTGTTQATLSGEDTTYRFWSGGTSGSTADFSVSKTGEIIAKKISIYNNEGGLIFSSDAGFSDLALTQISAVTGTPVQSVSDTFSANGDTSASWQSITLVANTNLTVSVALNTLFGGDAFSNTSQGDAISSALATIPDDFTLQMQYSSDGGSNWINIPITTGGTGNSQEFEKTTSTNPSAQQYSVDITTENESGFHVAFADVRKGNTLSNYGSVDANGFTNITGTITNLAGTSSGTTYKFRTLVSTTDSGYNTINKVTATAPRTLTITDTSGSGFYIDNGDGSQTVPTGDITSVSVTTASNSGLTGGQTFSSGAASFTLALASSIDGNKTFTNNVIIGGDLTVQGTTTTIDTTNLDVKDKNITLNYGTGDTSGNANGAGITIQDAVNSTTDATLTWNTSNDSFNFSHPVNVTGNVTATAYYGDGSNLTGITGTATTINNNADNRIITGSGTANTLNAESGLTYNGSTLAVTGAINSGAITSSGNLHAGDGTNISMDSSANGQLEVDGNGYQGAIALDGSAMHIYQNSASRNLVFGTNETARLTISGTGGFNFESNPVQGITTLSSGAITSTGASSFTDLAIGGAADANYDLKVYGLARFQGTTNFVSSGNVIQIGGQTILDASRNLSSIGTINSGAITSTGDISGATIEGYTFPSFPSVSGYLLRSDTNGNLQWTANAISSYTNSQDDRVITSTGSTGVNAESTLTYNTTDGLKITGNSPKLTFDASLGGSELNMDSTVQGFINFKHGSTTDASIGYEGVFNNKLVLSSSTIRLSGAVETSGAINVSGTVTATGGNSTNWNTAYTVANAALPKAGGTMTGGITMGSNNIASTGYVTATRLRVGDGTDGFFYSDTAGRTAFNSGDFYLQSGVNNYFNYATNQYHGSTSGDNHYFRGNPLTGDNWSIPATGTITSTGIRTGAITARVKLGVWNDTTYGIGMQSGYTYGGLNNDYAMSFQMNNDNDRGFWWGDETHTNAQGAMALTTNGLLTVANGLRVGYGESDTAIPPTGQLQVNGTISSGAITSSGQINAGTNLVAGTSVYSGNGVYYGSTTLDLKNNTSGNFLSFAANANATFAGTISSGAITSTGISNFQRDIRSAGQIRATGWYGNSASTDYTGMALEIGTPSSQPHILAYNRDTASYGLMQIHSAGLTIDPRSNDVTIKGVVNLTDSGHYEINGTTVIDASRNLTNIGTINSGAITSTGNSVFTGSSSSGNAFTVKRGSDGVTAFRVLNTGEVLVDNNYLYVTASQGSYFQNAVRFRGGISNDTAGAALTIGDDLNVTGIIQKSGTTVIDSSRNLTNIGTINSGAITSSATSNFERFRLTDSSKMGFGTVKAGATIGHTASVDEGIFWHTGNDYGIYRTAGTWSSPNYQQLKLQWATGIEIDGNGTAYGKSGINFLNGNIKMDGTQIIDASRNFSNIGTISSGKITTSGTGTAGVPTLDIINSSSSTFNHSIEAMTPNLTANESNILVFGKAGSTKNSGYIGYYYVGAGSNSNFVSIGHWSADHLFRVYGDGTVRASTGRFSSYGGGYDVSGTTVIDASRNLTNIGLITANGGSGQHQLFSSSDAPLVLQSSDATSGVAFVDNSGTNYLFYSGSLNHFYTNNGTLGVGVASAGSGQALNVAGGIGISSTTVIDSSRNFSGQSYSGAANSANFAANTATAYGTWKTSGSKGGYDGIVFDSGGDVAIMYDSGGNGGIYRQSGVGWHTYFHEGNDCLGVCDSTTSSSYSLYVSGAIYSTGNITAYSDRRIKENIVTIDKPLTKVEGLRGVYYNKIDDANKNKQIGFIAQEVDEVVPELVTYAEDVDQYGVNYGNATALLVEAIKELSQQVKDQQKQIDELKQRLDNDSSN